MRVLMCIMPNSPAHLHVMSYFLSRSAWISVEQGYTHLRKNWALDAYGRLVYLTCRGTSWNGQLLIWHISKHNWFDMKVDDSETSLDDSTATEYLFQNSRGRISSSWKNRSLTCLSEHSPAELMYDQRAIESDWLWEATRNIRQTIYVVLFIRTFDSVACLMISSDLWRTALPEEETWGCVRRGVTRRQRGGPASRHHMAKQIRQTWWKNMEKHGKTETVRIEMHRGVHDVVGICRCFLTYTYIWHIQIQLILSLFNSSKSSKLSEPESASMSRITWNVPVPVILANGGW